MKAFVYTLFLPAIFLYKSSQDETFTTGNIEGQNLSHPRNFTNLLNTKDILIIGEYLMWKHPLVTLPDISNIPGVTHDNRIDVMVCNDACTLSCKPEINLNCSDGSSVTIAYNMSESNCEDTFFPDPFGVLDVSDVFGYDAKIPIISPEEAGILDTVKGSKIRKLIAVARNCSNDIYFRMDDTDIIVEDYNPSIAHSDSAAGSISFSGRECMDRPIFASIAMIELTTKIAETFVDIGDLYVIKEEHYIPQKPGILSINTLSPCRIMNDSNHISETHARWRHVYGNISYHFDLKTDDNLIEYKNSEVTHLKTDCVELNSMKEWSANGCLVQPSVLQEATTSCACSGSSLYAVRQNVTVRELTLAMRAAFAIGLSLGAISSLLLLLTMCLLVIYRRKLSKDRTPIQISVALSYFCENLISYMGIGALNSNPFCTKLCEAVVVLHSYFLITSTLCLLDEGILLYVKVGLVWNLETSETNVRRNVIIILMVMTWGTPFILLMPTVPMAFITEQHMDTSILYDEMLRKIHAHSFNNQSHTHQIDQYRKYTVCWSGIDKLLGKVVFFPVTFVYLLNSILVVWAARVVWSKNDQDSSNASKKRKATYLTIRAIVLLMLVLGTPYMLSILLFIVDMSLLFYALSGFVLVLQGFVVFYLFILQNEHLRFLFTRDAQRRWSNFSHRKR